MYFRKEKENKIPPQEMCEVAHLLGYVRGMVAILKATTLNQVVL